MRAGLSENVAGLGPFWLRAGGELSISNEWGHLVFRPEGSHGPNILALTQVFLTGEVWGINGFLMRDREDFKAPILPSLPFETTYFDSLRRYVDLLSKLGITTPIALEAGLVDVKGVSLARAYGITYGPIRQNEIIFEYLLKDLESNSLNDCLLKFFERVYDHTPYSRPANDWGFPPGPPHQ